MTTNPIRRKPITKPDPQCPIRIGESCTLCIPGASGPQDCSLVQLVMTDPELREQLHQLRLNALPRGSP